MAEYQVDYLGLPGSLFTQAIRLGNTKEYSLVPEGLLAWIILRFAAKMVSFPKHLSL